MVHIRSINKYFPLVYRGKDHNLSNATKFICYGTEKKNQTCSPNFEKLAERIDGETIISLLEKLSTRDVAFTAV